MYVGSVSPKQFPLECLSLLFASFKWIPGELKYKLPKLIFTDWPTIFKRINFTNNSLVNTPPPLRPLLKCMYWLLVYLHESKCFPRFSFGLKSWDIHLICNIGLLYVIPCIGTYWLMCIEWIYYMCISS